VSSSTFKPKPPIFNSLTNQTLSSSFNDALPVFADCQTGTDEENEKCFLGNVGNLTNTGCGQCLLALSLYYAEIEEELPTDPTEFVSAITSFCVSGDGPPTKTKNPWNKLIYVHTPTMPLNEHRNWLKKGDWPAVDDAMGHPDTDEDLLRRKYEERDEHGRLPHHWLAAKAQTHTHTLASVGVMSICLNKEALTTRDNKGETPIDIARRSGACAEIIGLLSLTPEEARSLGWDEMGRLYAPVSYWMSEMAGWIQSRSYADCHKFFNEHDDELVREVLKYRNSDLLRWLACDSQVYSYTLVFLALRMIHRNPLSLQASDEDGDTPLQLAEHPQFNACNEIQNVLSLTPTYISSTPLNTLLRQHLPKQFVDEEVIYIIGV